MQSTFIDQTFRVKRDLPDFYESLLHQDTLSW